MGADFYAYAIVGVRITASELNGFLDKEISRKCCGKVLEKKFTFCPYCSKEIKQVSSAREYFMDDAINVPNKPTLHVVTDEGKEIYYIGHSIHTYYQNDFVPNKHFIPGNAPAAGAAASLDSLIPALKETLESIDFEYLDRFGLYVVCNCYA